MQLLGLKKGSNVTQREPNIPMPNPGRRDQEPVNRPPKRP
jgi:hypothetical protein